jgi:hypothetical protein
MNIPILILVYNRSLETRILINALRKIKPKRIFISSDGPTKKLLDIKKNNKVKKIIKKINWTKNIQLNYMKKNYGCKESVSRGISWFFNQVKMGIILEDDCIPNKDFFLFTEKMLIKYKNNKKIYVVSGNNFLKNKIQVNDSYYFSKYNHCWGWASWSRAWKNYDKNLSKWNNFKNTKYWKYKFDVKHEKIYWEKIFNLCYKKKIDSWAYPWLYSIWKKRGFCILPKVNLVKNIGFNINASHTFSHKKFFFPTKKLRQQITHPKIIKINSLADKFVFNNFFCPKNFLWPYRFIYLLNIFIRRPILFIKILIKKINGRSILLNA